MEHKNLQIEAVNLKFAEEGRKFSGYASVFGGVDSYGDTIMPGAYKQTIANRERPIQMRFNHLPGVIGKWTRIEEDEKGLFVEGELTPGHSKAEDAYALLKHGAISGLSIGYRPVKAVENQHGGVDLHEIDLVEISVVESPADMAAQISDVKSAIEQAETRKEFEELLRNAGGFSRADAKALVSRIKSLGHRNDGDPDNDSADMASIFQQLKL